ncbi:MAG: hypothetical protein JXX28_14955 [Deltaproteobacteria bacterium]|nr:hypothetical protein [Deltaproteobacteria bacterium]
MNPRDTEDGRPALWTVPWIAPDRIVQGTSLSAPTVSGAAVLLKDYFIDTFGTSFANSVGNLFATLILMGDGQMQDGHVAVPGTNYYNDPLDPWWGAGRLQMRLFNDQGMDAPWRARWCTRLVDDGEVTTCDVNPDSNGVNQPLPAEVSHLKAVAWWFDPGVNIYGDPAEIGMKLTGSYYTYTAEGSAPQVKRIHLGSAAANHAMQVRLEGLNVPRTWDTSYYFYQKQRMVHVAMYYED